MVRVARPNEPRVLPGSLITLRRKCGNAGCRCATGEPHETPALSYSVGGRTKMLTLRAEDVPAVAAAVARYAELEAAFRELRRVIRPSGVAMVGFHSGTGAHAKTEGYGGHPMRVQVH